MNKPKKKKKSPTCQVPGCEKAVYILRHQLCTAHYGRLIKLGSVGDAFVRKRTPLKKPYVHSQAS